MITDDFRVMEQENPGLKRQLEMDENLYEDEFSKEDTKDHERKEVAKDDDVTVLLIKDENREDLGHHHSDSVDQSNNNNNN